MAWIANQTKTSEILVSEVFVYAIWLEHFGTRRCFTSVAFKSSSLEAVLFWDNDMTYVEGTL